LLVRAKGEFFSGKDWLRRIANVRPYPQVPRFFQLKGVNPGGVTRLAMNCWIFENYGNGKKPKNIRIRTFSLRQCALVGYS
jgi:hypothetical protein